MYNSYSPNTRQSMPPVIKNLLIINVLVFVMTHIIANPVVEMWIIDTFALNYGFNYLKPWQFITYMFMHADFTHLLFNMFSLWMFGTVIEQYLGSKRFLYFYLVCGIGAAVIHLLTLYLMYPDPSIRMPPTVGASGSIYGVLFAFAFIYPNMKILLYFLFPIKAKYLIGFFILMELYLGFRNSGDNIAHFAHLGGVLFAYFMLRSWRAKRII